MAILSLVFTIKQWCEVYVIIRDCMKLLINFWCESEVDWDVELPKL